ncbi:sarcosine oxidase [Hypoxylon argillaceum]|nr:sarcosine oxidase [Hypoxylon argillaceum]
MSQHQSYLVVGAGVFGATTALELKRQFPEARVTLLDRVNFPSPSAASHDVNKIIRADYGDILYMKLALEAQTLWRTDPIYKPYYHETGMLYAENTGLGKSFIENYKTLGFQHASELISPPDAKERFGAFKDANWTGVTDTYFNPKSAWGDGAGALKSVIEAAIDYGVEFKVAPVAKLSINSSKNCVGVFLEDSTELQADKVIVAMGAWTPTFLAESAIDCESLLAGDRMIAAGAIQCCATVPPEHSDLFKNSPVMVNLMDHTIGECIPPTEDGKIKFNYEVSFTNNLLHQPSGKVISVPPSRPSRSTWGQDVPQGLKDEIHTVMRHIYGHRVKLLKIDGYRMDCVTPNQDWIIARHPQVNSLYFATGGSFHSWKFMPTIGRYAVQMVKGELSDELSSRWAWDRPTDGGALPEHLPKRDLKDIAGYSE